MGYYRSKHECVTYSCNECVYKTVDKSTLRKHKQHKHEWVKYECDHQSSTQGSIKRHRESKHEGVIYNVTSVNREIF